MFLVIAMNETHNPIPHIIKDLHTWSTTDLALLIVHLNHGVYQEFLKRIMEAPPEDIEENWTLYRKMMQEIKQSQNLLISMEQYPNWMIKYAETLAFQRALRRPISPVYVANVEMVSFSDPPEMKNKEFEK